MVETLLMENEKINENVDVETKTNLEFELLEDVRVILLKVNNSAFNTKVKPYDLKLCGKSSIEWLLNTTTGARVKQVECNRDDDFVTLIKPHLDDTKYTFVIYSDTPLLQRKTFLDVIDYIKLKKLSIVKLTRGYIFETDYLKSVEKLYSPQTCYFDEEDFMTAYNLKQFAMINDVFKNRIVSYFMKKGVNFVDANNVYIEADVNIESDVTIYPFNSLKGETIISSGTVLKEGNILENAIISKNCEIEKSVIKDSIIGQNCVVCSFAEIINKSLVKDNSRINSFVKINNSKVDAFKNIESFTNIMNKRGEWYVAYCWAWESGG